MNSDIRIGKRQKISEMIVDEIVRKIRIGELNIGDKLPDERSLAETLGVSRMPIREAIHALTQAGILKTRHGEGTYVKSFDSEKLGKTIYWFSLLDKKVLSELIETRKVLEPEAARLACRYGTDLELDAIKIAMLEREKYEDITPDDTEGLENRFTAGRAFHEAIFTASHNSVIKNFLEALRASSRLHQKATFKLQRDTGNTIHLHREIFEAISARDEVKAEMKMKEHLGQVEEAVQRINQS